MLALREWKHNRVTAALHMLSYSYPINGPRQANLCLRAFRHDKF